jgi:hypothetical protein
VFEENEAFLESFEHKGPILEKAGARIECISSRAQKRTIKRKHAIECKTL